LAGQFFEFGQWRRQLFGGWVLRVLLAPGVDGGLLLLQGAGALHRAGQLQPAGQVSVTATLQLLCRQRRDQGPDAFVVAGGGFATQQRRDKHALTCGSEGLPVGFQRLGAYQLGAHLLIDWQLGQALHAWLVEGLQGAFRFVAGQGQFGAQGAGEDLLGWLESGDRHLLKNLRGAAQVLLLIRLIGCGQTQRGGLFRLSLGGLLQQLFDAGLWGAWQFAKGGGRRA
jgi:hypothetical protein